MKKIQIFSVVIVLLSFAVGISLYGQMPERMASHWNVQGEVDGYIPKFWGLFLIPLISAGLLLLFLAIPKIDPLKANTEKFRKYYDGLIAFLMAFFLYLYLLTIAWTVGVAFDMMTALVPAFGLLFYYCGILLENAKQNWFVGIRTPWTLSSEKVWDKTHKLGGRLFKICGIVAFFGLMLPDYAIFLVIVPVILVAAYTVVYSYLEYRKEKA